MTETIKYHVAALAANAQISVPNQGIGRYGWLYSLVSY